MSEKIEIFTDISAANYFQDTNGYWGFMYRVQKLDGSWEQKRIRGKKRNFKLKKQAKEYYDTEIVQNRRITTKNATYDTVAASFLEQYKMQVLESSYERMTKIVSTLSVTFGNSDLSKVTAKNIIDYFAKIYDAYSGSELKKRFTVLKAIFSHAQQFFELRNDPFKHIKFIKKDQKTYEVEDFWTVDEFNFINDEILKRLEIADETSEKDLLLEQAILNTLFWVGLRLGELIVLNEKDLYKNDGVWYLNICKTQTKVKNGYETKQGTKTGTSRELPIDNELAALLLKMVDIHKHFYGYDKNKALLISKDGITPISRNKPYRTIQKYTLRHETINVHYINPHRMRHSHGSVLLNNGEDLAVVSKRLGHKDTSTTEKYYVRIYKKRLMNVINTINKIKNIEK
ncbi:site-specific integrase [Erysipelotrichaceae bacterium]|nr:site-specific integrase [Erysipelotrichaceae bacterium]